MLKHPAIVALAAAVFDLLALGPVPDDPDGPQAAIDEAVMGKVVRCVDAAGAVVDDLSEAECHEAMALIGAAEKKDEGAPRSGGAPHRRHQDVRSLSEEPPARLEGVAPQPAGTHGPGKLARDRGLCPFVPRASTGAERHQTSRSSGNTRFYHIGDTRSTEETERIAALWPGRLGIRRGRSRPYLQGRDRYFS